MPSYRKIKNDLIYGIIRALMVIIESLPRDLALKLAGLIGEIAALIDARERRLAEANLRRVYGNSWSDLKIRLVARECFVKMARNTADVIRSRGWTAEDLADLVNVEGMEHFDGAMKKGKGVVAITGHIGNFELSAAWFASVKKTPISIIGRKLYDERIDRLVVENRERFGMEYIASDAPARKVLSVLKSGRMLGVLMDLNFSKVSGYYIPFFRIPARTAAGPIAVGRHTGSPVVPLALFRTDDDRFFMKVLPAFDIPHTDDKEADIKAALLQCNKALETLINYDPTQWPWIHDRWKGKPTTEINVKDQLEEIAISGAQPNNG
jgi:KDO2-lipid IV(A) lauroyltransferase